MPDDTRPAATHARLSNALADASLVARDMVVLGDDLGTRLLDAAPLIPGPATIEGTYLTALIAVARARSATAEAATAVRSLIDAHSANQP